MRPILFRGFYETPNGGKTIYVNGKRVGKWVEGFYIQSNPHVIKHSKTGAEFEVIPETVGQFTGLYDSTSFERATEEQLQYAYQLADKNGTTPEHEWKGIMIFEDDMMVDLLDNEKEEYHVFYYEKYAFFSCGGGYINKMAKIKVTGTIFDEGK